MKPVAVHVAPHPDDEVLGAGATLCQLRSSGWSIHNLACSLGRPDDRERRRRELLLAADRAGFGTTIMEPIPDLSATADLNAAAHRIAEAVGDLLDRTGAALVLSPHPHDGHHAHEAVGRAVMEAVRARQQVTWWMWGLWADLPLPTVFVPFDEECMTTVQNAIAAYGGENQRNRFDDLYAARARAAAGLGSERVFGFGAPRASDLPYAELLTEVAHDGEAWRLGRPRTLDPPHVAVPAWMDGVDLAEVLAAQSPRHAIRMQRLRVGEAW